MADALGIARTTLSSYEIGTAEPNLITLQNIADYFELSIDLLLTKDLQEAPALSLEAGGETYVSGQQLRVLSITVDDKSEENIELVPVQVSAGYLDGHTDPEFIASLPRFRLPMLPPGTYRAFEIRGDSMFPVTPGSIVVAEYMLNWKDIKDDKTYILVTQQEGIVFKRLFNQIAEKGVLILQSDNKTYEPYQVKIEDVLEVWQTRAVITLDMPVTSNILNDLTEMVKKLQMDVDSLKQRQY